MVRSMSVWKWQALNISNAPATPRHPRPSDEKISRAANTLQQESDGEPTSGPADIDTLMDELEGDFLWLRGRVGLAGNQVDTDGVS